MWEQVTWKHYLGLMSEDCLRICWEVMKTKLWVRKCLGSHENETLDKEMFGSHENETLGEDIGYVRKS